LYALVLEQLRSQQDPVAEAVPIVKVEVPAQKYCRELHGVSFVQSDPIEQQDGTLLRPMMQYSELSQQTEAPTSEPASGQFMYPENEEGHYMDADLHHNHQHH
jgi:hypothetical protein